MKRLKNNEGPNKVLECLVDSLHGEEVIVVIGEEGAEISPHANRYLSIVDVASHIHMCNILL